MIPTFRDQGTTGACPSPNPMPHRHVFKKTGDPRCPGQGSIATWVSMLLWTSGSHSRIHYTPYVVPFVSRSPSLHFMPPCISTSATSAFSAFFSLLPIPSPLIEIKICLHPQSHIHLKVWLATATMQFRCFAHSPRIMNVFPSFPSYTFASEMSNGFGKK